MFYIYIYLNAREKCVVNLLESTLAKVLDKKVYWSLKSHFSPELKMGTMADISVFVYVK